MQQKVIQIGNSAGIIIPKFLLSQVNMKIGEELEIESVSSREAILIRRKSKKSKGVSSLTLEFFAMLEDFNKRHATALRGLAKQ